MYDTTSASAHRGTVPPRVPKERPPLPAAYLVPKGTGLGIMVEILHRAPSKITGTAAGVLSLDFGSGPVLRLEDAPIEVKLRLVPGLEVTVYELDERGNVLRDTVLPLAMEGA